MSKFALSDKLTVQFNRIEDDTPVIIFEDLSSENIVIEGNKVTINLDVDEDAMEEIISTLEHEERS